ncbi:MAG: type II secretion system F family protein [Brockia lithotrophica]|nr:type II secretion system F family protein [Brockia lithotrophica]
MTFLGSAFFGIAIFIAFLRFYLSEYEAYSVTPEGLWKLFIRVSNEQIGMFLRRKFSAVDGYYKNILKNYEYLAVPSPKEAADEYFGKIIFLTIVSTFLGIFFNGIFFVFAAFIPLYLPYRLNYQKSEYESALSKGLVQFTQFLAVATSSGMSPAEALRNVAEQEPRQPFFARMRELYYRSQTEGIPIQTLLAEFSKKYNVKGLPQFVERYIIALKLESTEASKSFINLAEYFVRQRLLQLEKDISSLRVKLLVPTLIIFLSIFVVIFGMFFYIVQNNAVFF